MLLRFVLGPICWSGLALVAVARIARVEVSLLDGPIDGIEDESVEAVLVEVLLKGKDLRFQSCVSHGARLVTDQLLGFCCVLGTLSHCGRALFQDFGPDLRRE